MGLYSDISTDLIAALDTDLSDATVTINLTVYGEGVYAPATGTNVPPETAYSFRGVRLEFDDSYVINEATREGGVKLLVMDSEVPTGLTLRPGNKLTIDTDTQTFSILKVMKDPADVTHTLTCELRN